MINLGKYLMLLCLLFAITFSDAQKNLVPNPGFEEAIPKKPSRTFNAINSPNFPIVKDWAQPTAGSADYYNSDKSTIWGTPVKKARSGQGRAAIIANPKKLIEYTEYITTKLTEPLVEDKLYMVKMYYSLDRRCTHFAPSIGINFTIDYLSTNNTQTLPVKPQLVCTDPVKNSSYEGWIELSGVYKAYGGEQYLTIGCFDTRNSIPITGRKKYLPVSKLDSENHIRDYAYYYIDDVCVTEITDDPFCQNCCPVVLNKNKAYNNFVFMIDISSSMYDGGYISEVKKAVVDFVDTLGKNDLVSIVTFDGHSYVLAKGIPASEKDSIVNLIGTISAGSSTNINKAVSTTYYLMDSLYIPNGNNRVILVSDAVFELSKESSSRIKNAYKSKNVAFTMVQFGNQYNAALEKVCKKTNGNYGRTKNQEMKVILQGQLDHANEDDYTPENKKAGRFKIVRVSTLLPPEPQK
ncbi:MAG TPA: VWA domain-containing protein [Flavobacteriales bacterium]|nr:VWA domain-containing protein [Flavobacteriales bacterium]